jgi:hypothetical protein
MNQDEETEQPAKEILLIHELRTANNQDFNFVRLSVPLFQTVD